MRAVFHQFQDGYTHRTVNVLDEFIEPFVPDDDREVIGTGAEAAEQDEWCLGRTAARTLDEGDWQGWGDVALGVDRTRIHALGDVAWLAAFATVTRTLDTQMIYTKHLEAIQRTQRSPICRWKHASLKLRAA